MAEKPIKIFETLEGRYPEAEVRETGQK